MNNYLLQLLKEVKTLIIPGLGALTVTNETTGEIMFMPYLKFDDGTLAQHIANKENMDLNDAKNLIAKFVREVTVALDKGHSYDMYQFGSFGKVDGEIVFTKWGNNPSVETTSAPEEEPAKPVITTETPKVSEPEVPPVKEPEPPKEELKPEEPVKTTPIASPPKPEPVPEKAPETHTKVPPLTPEPPKVATPKEDAKATTPKKDEPVKTVEQAKKPEKKKVEKPVKEKSESGKKRSVLVYILWGFFVLIIGGGTYVFFNFNELKKDFPILADLAGESKAPEKDSTTKELADEPEVNMDENTASEPVPDENIEGMNEETQPEEATPPPVEKPVKETPVKPTKQTTNVGKADTGLAYHVIAGSFGSESNAKRMAANLQAKGFPDASIMQNNGMYRVSVKGYGSLNEAMNAAKSMQGDISGAWVLKL